MVFDDVSTLHTNMSKKQKNNSLLYYKELNKKKVNNTTLDSIQWMGMLGRKEEIMDYFEKKMTKTVENYRKYSRKPHFLPSKYQFARFHRINILQIWILYLKRNSDNSLNASKNIQKSHDFGTLSINR